MRSEGKPLYFTNQQANPESWGGGEAYYQPEETWNRETQAELNKPASGLDYSEDVGRRFPLQGESQGQQQPGAGGQKNKGYILNQALAELQTHIPGIVKHTLGGKSKPTNAQEKKAVQQNIQKYLSLIMADMEKGKTRELEEKKISGKTPSASFADKEKYKYMVNRLKELDEQLHGEWSADLTDEERAKIQNERKVILDGMMDLEKTMSGGGMQRGGRSTQRAPGGSRPKIDKRTAIKAAMDSGASKEDIRNFISQNPNASVQDFLSHFKTAKGTPETKQQEAQAAPDVKNTPVSGSGLQRKENAPGPDERAKAKQGVAELMKRKRAVPYATSMTQPPTEEQKAAAKQELTDLARKLGVGPENIEALGQLAKDVGGWAWESYNNALNTLYQGQAQARQQLPAYKKG